VNVWFVATTAKTGAGPRKRILAGHSSQATSPPPPRSQQNAFFHTKTTNKDTKNAACISKKCPANGFCSHAPPLFFYFWVPPLLSLPPSPTPSPTKVPGWRASTTVSLTRTLAYFHDILTHTHTHTRGHGHVFFAISHRHSISRVLTLFLFSTARPNIQARRHLLPILLFLYV